MVKSVSVQLNVDRVDKYTVVSKPLIFLSRVYQALSPPLSGSGGKARLGLVYMVVGGRGSVVIAPAA